MRRKCEARRGDEVVGPVDVSSPLCPGALPGYLPAYLPTYLPWTYCPVSPQQPRVTRAVTGAPAPARGEVLCDLGRGGGWCGGPPTLPEGVKRELRIVLWSVCLGGGVGGGRKGEELCAREG